MSEAHQHDAYGADEAQEFVEETGLLFETAGGPRAAGRMLGWLLVCDPPHQSAEQLASALRASSGGVSTSARFLVQAGYVERFGVAGDRRTYYRVKPGAWTRSLDEQLAAIVRFRRLADRGLQVLDGTPPARRQRLEQMRDLFGFLEERYPALVESYQHRSEQG